MRAQGHSPLIELIEVGEVGEVGITNALRRVMHQAATGHGGQHLGSGDRLRFDLEQILTQQHQIGLFAYLDRTEFSDQLLRRAARQRPWPRRPFGVTGGDPNPLQASMAVGVSGVEVYDNLSLTPWLSLTPDLQIIRPATAGAPLLTVLGLRTLLRF